MPKGSTTRCPLSGDAAAAGVSIPTPPFYSYRSSRTAKINSYFRHSTEALLPIA